MTTLLSEAVSAPSDLRIELSPPTGSPGLDTSVGKALTVLDVFLGEGTLLGVSQIAARAQLPKSTTHRLLAVLVEHGYVERVDARYRLGRAIFELGNMVSDCRPRSLRSIAMPYMTNLYEASHATVNLAVLDGSAVLYVEKIYGHRAVDLPSRVGGRVPALCTALGKAILAFAHPEVQEEALSQRVPRLTPRTVVNQAVLRSTLANVRATGIAEDSEGACLGAHCIGAPIIDRTGTVVASVSVSFTTSVRIPAATIRLLRQSATLIGEAC
jgi:DNA-binding IclR family transcriptional regulator